MTLRFITLPPPHPGGTPYVWLDATDPSTMFTTTGQTTNVVNDGDDCAAIVSKGIFTGTWDITPFTTNPPRYTLGVLNGFSGLRFDAANTEALATTAGPGTNPLHTKPGSWLCIGYVHGQPSGIGRIVTVQDSEYGDVELNATNVTVTAMGNKVSQSWAHGNGPAGFACWADSPLGTHQEASINTVSGTDGPTYKFQRSINDTDVSAIGLRPFGGTLFADNVSILEFISWRETLGTTIAEMEAYVATKYGLAWVP